jgi:hypothetical protein
MYTAACRLNPTEALAVELPALVGALAIAELWYKFHSFTLEAGAFLLTWAALGWLIAAGRTAVVGRSPAR